MLSELFWISLGVASTMDDDTKNPRVESRRGLEYIKRLGYNQSRQLYLHDLVYSVDEDKQQEFYNILGHRIDWSKYKKYHKDDRRRIAYEEAIQEISINEGWKYFDDNELYADPVFRSLIGMQRRPAIISYKAYPEKVLLPPGELQKLKADIIKDNDAYDENTLKSVALPIVFCVMSIIFASSSSHIGFVIAVLSMIGAVISTYVCWWLYKDKKANGGIQFIAYIACPIIAPAQLTRAFDNYDISSEAGSILAIFFLFVVIFHMIFMFVSSIYCRNEYK